MPDWLTTAKLAPNIDSGNLLPRPEMLQALDGAVPRRLVLVCAPAGYGKTSALAQWWESQKIQSVRCAWLTLEQYDAKPGRFLAYVSASCLAAQFKADTPIPQSLRAASKYEADSDVAALTNALQKCKGRHTLVLDNFHEADNRDTAAIVHAMLASLPRTFQVVIASRRYPSGIGLANLLAQDDAVVLTEANLRFTEDEARAYLQRSAGVEVAARICEAAVKKSEGWPVAIQFFGRRLSKGKDTKDILRQIDGRNATFADYFTELVFNQQSPEVQDFLLRTAFLRLLNGDLTNDICSIKSGWRILERLARDNLFVRPVDDNREWYARHRLFQQYLEAKARHQENIEPSQIYAAAASWCLDNGHKADGLNYATLSRSAAVIAATLEALGGWQYVVGQGNVANVGEALARVDEGTLQRFPRVWLAKIYLDLKAGEPERAEREFKRFSQAIDSGQPTQPLADGELQVFRSMVSVYCDHDVRAGAQEPNPLDALECAAQYDHGFLQAVRCNLLCVLYGQHSQFEQAFKAGDKALGHFRQLGSLYGEIFVLFHQGYLLHLQGRLRQAWLVLMEGCELAAKSFGQDSGLNAIGSAFLAGVAYERNDSVRASQHLEAALPQIERFDAWLEVYITAYATALALAFAEEDEEKANEMLRRAISTADGRGLPRLAQAISACFRCHQLQRAMETGRSESLVEFDPSGSDAHPLTQHFAVCASGWQLMSQQQFAWAAKHFADQAEASKTSGQMRDYVSLTVLQGMAELNDNRQDAALSTLQRALVAGAAEGVKRPFLEQGAACVALLKQIAQQLQGRPDHDALGAFLKELLTEIYIAKPPAPKGDNLLTPREREILQSLVQNCSNKEIANLMGISVNTVKFHLKNIFLKLEAYSRKDVVRSVVRKRLI